MHTCYMNEKRTDMKICVCVSTSLHVVAIYYNQSHPKMTLSDLSPSVV